MARRQPLRVVAEGEPPARKHTVASAAAEGSRRDLLVAMRDRVATTVENPNTPARDLAALTRRLLEISNEIEALDVREREESQGGAGVPDEAFDASAV